MGKKKKDSIELRFYEIPQNEYALALLEDSWVRSGGHDDAGLHFHNLMEVGVCRGGTGDLILEEGRVPYQTAMISVIPCNFPHDTVGNGQDNSGVWEYLYFDPAQLAAELYRGDALLGRDVAEKINSRALLVHEWEYRNFALLVKMIMEEMRRKRPHYNESVRGLLAALVMEIIRMNEQDEGRAKPDAPVRKNTGVTQIAAALDYVRVYYGRLVRVEELAKVCHMSETHFRRVFEACMNMSPVDYINQVRIQKACDLMKKSNDSMDTVAQKVGFATTSTFNRNFKKFLNTSPYQWKLNHGNCERKLPNDNIAAPRG